MRILESMWGWLNSNAGAVQAVGAAVTALVTTILVIITAWYARLTNKLRRSAEDQFNLGQRQFELAQKQFHAAYMPQLSLAIAFRLGSPVIVRYLWSNHGNAPVRVQLIRINVKVKPEWSWEDKEVEGTIFPPVSYRETSRAQEIPLPDEVWSRVTATGLQGDEIKQLLSIETIVGDPAGLVAYRCVWDPASGYSVSVVD